MTIDNQLQIESHDNINFDFNNIQQLNEGIHELSDASELSQLGVHQLESQHPSYNSPQKRGRQLN